ncbi:3'-5' exonuclease [Pseudomonas aeruginosa]
MCRCGRRIRLMIANKVLPGRAASALTGFVELIENLSAKVMDMPLHLDDPDGDRAVRTDQLPQGRKRRERPGPGGEPRGTGQRRPRFRGTAEGRGRPHPAAGLPQPRLPGGRETQADAHEDSVQLMTPHSAKGLEFLRWCSWLGMEEGLLPHKMSLEESPAAWKRNAAWPHVGVTRAMQRLVLTCARTRRLFR